MIVHTIYGAERLPALEPLRAAGIPIYRSLEASARAMGALRRHATACRRRGPATRRSRPEADQVAALLAGYRRGACCPSPSAAGSSRSTACRCRGGGWRPARRTRCGAVEELGVPAALKLVARGVVHKSDIGAVRLGISGREAARGAWATLMGRRHERGLRTRAFSSPR